MTAEELLRLCDRIISSGGFDTLTSIDRCAIARALRDRLTDAQAVTLTEEERATVEYYRKSTWRTARKLLAIIDRLTGASTP